jgi:hypothetical protein
MVMPSRIISFYSGTERSGVLQQTFRQERIAERPGKWEVNDPASVHVSNFCCAQEKFPPAKNDVDEPIRSVMSRDFLMKLLEIIHTPQSIGFCFR